jgi:hypothetical protein
MVVDVPLGEQTLPGDAGNKVYRQTAPLANPAPITGPRRPKPIGWAALLECNTIIDRDRRAAR